MNSASARLEAFPETFDEKIRRRLGPKLGSLDFCKELSIDVAADVSLGGVALIGHKGSPSISISNCAIAWRDVVNPSSRTDFITRELFLRVSSYQFSFWHGKTFLRVYIERPRSNHALSNWSECLSGWKRLCPKIDLGTGTWRDDRSLH